MADTQIAFTELLGRRVRMGAWEDQKISTFRKILEALDEGRWDNAAELYKIDDDPHAWENRWDDPSSKAIREDLVADLYDNLPKATKHLKVERPA